ncbi:hypothetical protein SprV_0100166800 [Sparganum proliferum]
MGLFGHMRIHEGGNDRSPDTPSIPTMAGSARSPQTGAPTPTSSIILGTSCTPTMLSPTHNPSISAPTTAPPPPKLILTQPTSHVQTVPAHSPHALA